MSLTSVMIHVDMCVAACMHVALNCYNARDEIKVAALMGIHYILKASCDIGQLWYFLHWYVTPNAQTWSDILV